jgi:3-phosphoglycerate kinase
MKLKLPKIKDIKNKTVILRVDYNVPLEEKNGKIIVANDERIKVSIRTLSFLLENKAKVIIISHLGRPKGEINPKLSLEPIASVLKEKYHLPVEFVTDCIGDQVNSKLAKIDFGQALLLENLRFHPGEEKNDPGFAKQLADLADVYINDAFSVSHRAHASMVGIPEYLLAFAGFALEKEIINLQKLLDNPKKPFVIVIGGAKISDKVEAVKNLSQIADIILVGGGVANNFLKAEGLEIHKSYLQDASPDEKKQGVDYVKVAEDLIEDHKTERVLKDGYIPLPKILYPTDVIAAKNPDASNSQTIDLTHDMKDTPDDKDLMYLDIGPKTIKLYQEVILQAGTVFWNGPMGVFEKNNFTNGTHEIARAIARSSATTILGGGDTIAAISKFRMDDRFDYVSAAGGASLDFLAGKELPGLKKVIKHL